MADSISLAYLAGMFAVVAFGAVVPVLPTGAAVSVAAALAGLGQPGWLLAVVLVGAAGAYLGDIVTYAGLRTAGEALAKRVGWRGGERSGPTLTRLRERVESNDVRVLLYSRLIPAGRLPVLAAAALGGYPWRRFAVANVAGAALWSAMYALLGIAGRSLFPHPWEGVAAAIGLVVVVSLLSSAVQHYQSSRK